MSNRIDSSNKMSLNLEELVEFLGSHTIEEAYDFLQYDYKKEVEYEIETEKAGVRERVSDPSRDAFLKRLNWIDDPSHTLIRCVFNQINTFYAEKSSMQHLEINPKPLTFECNRLILYRQAKETGIRSKSNIQFGVHKDAVFPDPRRHFKRLRGMAPRFIERALEEWFYTIDSVPPEPKIAFLLALAIIAIHPFSDGNGRFGRLIYSWLTKRWGLSESWLSEDPHGEFLRVGYGIASTEHLMGEAMVELCGGYNRVKFGYRDVQTEEDDEQFLFCLNSQLQSIRQEGPTILFSTSFENLWDHLLKNGHFRSTSPRFECLTSIIR
jgi:Fic family protein